MTKPIRAAVREYQAAIATERTLHAEAVRAREMYDRARMAAEGWEIWVAHTRTALLRAIEEGVEDG